MRNVDVFAAVGYVPTPRQALFHASTEFDVLFGGSAGGGKTKSLVYDDLRDAIRYPGIRIGAFRRTYGELKESLLAELAEAGYGQALGAVWNGSNYELRFPNGSIIMYRYAETIKDATRRQGGQYQKLTFDERNLTPPDVVTFLESRLRSGRSEVPVLGIRSGCVDEGDVLTATGWKPIQDVQVGELVQSLNPHGQMVIKPVDWVFAGPATDGLVRVRKRTLYMSMTPDHRVVSQRDGARTHRIDPWNSLPNRSLNIVRAPRGYDAEGFAEAPLGWDVDNYLAFLGIYLAEGSTGNPRKANYKTIITQCDPDNQGVIKDLLNRLDLPRTGTIRELPSGNHNVRWYDEFGARRNRTFPTRQEAKGFLYGVRHPISWCLQGNGDFVITRRVVWEHFRQFGKAHEKSIPREILERATAGQLRTLFDWMVLGDGTVRESGKGLRYFTSSRRLADDVMEVALKLGYKVQVTTKNDENPAHRTRYIIHCNAERPTTAVYRADDGRQEAEPVPFNGDVFCIKVRDTENFILRQRGYVWVSGNTNPGGPGHGASKARYVDPTNYGERVITDARGRTVRFIPSKLSDNPHVNPEYAQDLAGLPDKLRRAFLDGDWNVFSGQVYSEWRNDRHTLPPMKLPRGWRRYAGVDWGYAAPWCVLWGAVDEDGRLWVYRELYQTQVGEAEQARRILAAEAGEPVAGRFADDAMWATRGDAKPISDVYMEQGVFLTQAGKSGVHSRVNGWQRIHTYLAEGPACPHHRAMGWPTCPRMHVFTTCENLIRTLPVLPHATTGDPEDADTTAEDHAPDTLRYLTTNLGSEPSWVFPSDPVDAVAVTIDPAATSPTQPVETPTVPMMGGFPVLQTGGPWGGSL